MRAVTVLGMLDREGCARLGPGVRADTRRRPAAAAGRRDPAGEAGALAAGASNGPGVLPPSDCSTGSMANRTPACRKRRPVLGSAKAHCSVLVTGSRRLESQVWPAESAPAPANRASATARAHKDSGRRRVDRPIDASDVKGPSRGRQHSKCKGSPFTTQSELRPSPSRCPQPETSARDTPRQATFELPS